MKDVLERDGASKEPRALYFLPRQRWPRRIIRHDRIPSCLNHFEEQARGPIKQADRVKVTAEKLAELLPKNMKFHELSVKLIDAGPKLLSHRGDALLRTSSMDRVTIGVRPGYLLVGSVDPVIRRFLKTPHGGLPLVELDVRAAGSG